MRFNDYRRLEALSHVFNVMIGDEEIAAIMTKEAHFRSFAHVVLDRLANMIAAYMFKRMRDDWQKFLQSDEIKQLVAAKLVASLTIQARP
jgi:hypothetical protein